MNEVRGEEISGGERSLEKMEAIFGGLVKVF
jgi:hypothetical protein